VKIATSQADMMSARPSLIEAEHLKTYFFSRIKAPPHALGGGPNF